MARKHAQGTPVGIVARRGTRVVVGCDGVLSDLRGGVVAVAREVTGEAHVAGDLPLSFELGTSSTSRDLMDLGLSRAEVAAVLGKIAARRGFAVGLAPHQSAVAGLRALRAAGAEVACWGRTWDPNPWWKDERLGWLALHFGVDVVHAMPDSGDVEADVLVDCRPQGVATWLRDRPDSDAVLWSADGDLRGVPVPAGAHFATSWDAVLGVVLGAPHRQLRGDA